MAYGSENRDPMGLSKMSQMFEKTDEPKQEEQVEEQAQKEEEPQEEQDIYHYLASIGGPSKSDIDQLKEIHGSIHLLPLNEDSVFVYRSLKRSEWNALKARFMQAGENLSEDQRKEQIVMKCLLWPSIQGTDVPLTEAGLIDSLYEAISISSYFLSSQMIMNMVMRL